MEVVGAVATIAQLAGTAYTMSKTLYEISDTLTSASEDIRCLAHDLSLFSQSLIQLQRLLDLNKTNYSLDIYMLTDKIIRDCTDIHNKIAKLISKLSREGMKGRFKWLYKEKRIRDLMGRLRDMKITLLGILSTLQLDLQLTQLHISSESTIERRDKDVLEKEDLSAAGGTEKEIEYLEWQKLQQDSMAANTPPGAPPKFFSKAYSNFGAFTQNHVVNISRGGLMGNGDDTRSIMTTASIQTFHSAVSSQDAMVGDGGLKEVVAPEDERIPFKEKVKAWRVEMADLASAHFGMSTADATAWAEKLPLPEVLVEASKKRKLEGEDVIGLGGFPTEKDEEKEETIQEGTAVLERRELLVVTAVEKANKSEGDTLVNDLLDIELPAPSSQTVGPVQSIEQQQMRYPTLDDLLGLEMDADEESFLFREQMMDSKDSVPFPKIVSDFGRLGSPPTTTPSSAVTEERVATKETLVRSKSYLPPFIGYTYKRFDAKAGAASPSPPDTNSQIKQHNLAKRSKYQFETDSEDDEEIEQEMKSRLNALARASGHDIDQQNRHIDRIDQKSDRIDDQIALNRARLDRIRDYSPPSRREQLPLRKLIDMPTMISQTINQSMPVNKAFFPSETQLPYIWWQAYQRLMNNSESWAGLAEVNYILHNNVVQDKNDDDQWAKGTTEMVEKISNLRILLQNAPLPQPPNLTGCLTKVDGILKVMKTVESTLGYKTAVFGWYCSCSVLTNVLDHSPIQDSALDQIAEIVGLIARYAVMENIYHHWEGMSLKKDYQDSLIDLSLQILIYFGRASTLWKGGIPQQAGIDELKVLADRINAADSKCRNFTVTVDTEATTSKNSSTVEDIWDSDEEDSASTPTELTNEAAVANLSEPILPIRDSLKPHSNG